MEKFLELNSEQNHDDYCLAYVFTDRDFDDGVLGLAWVGAPSGNAQRNKQMQMFAVTQRGVLLLSDVGTFDAAARRRVRLQ